MSNDLMIGISSFLTNSWRFFTDTTIPGTNITFAVLALGLALVPVGFQFLSIMTGHNIGETGVSGSMYGSRGSKDAKISDKRKNDVR